MQRLLSLEHQFRGEFLCGAYLGKMEAMLPVGGRVGLDDRLCGFGHRWCIDIRVMSSAECVETRRRKFVECREAEFRRAHEGPVAEAAEDVLVISAIQAVGIGHDRVHRGPQTPAVVFRRDGRPGARL